MKRAVPWIRVAGFIVGLVVLVAIFDYAFAQTGYVRYVLTYFQNSDEDIDTLVLGASHARSAIDPQKIDDVNDTNSFSLAIPGEMVRILIMCYRKRAAVRRLRHLYLMWITSIGWNLRQKDIFRNHSYTTSLAGHHQ